MEFFFSIVNAIRCKRPRKNNQSFISDEDSKYTQTKHLSLYNILIVNDKSEHKETAPHQQTNNPNADKSKNEDKASEIYKIQLQNDEEFQNPDHMKNVSCKLENYIKEANENSCLKNSETTKNLSNEGSCAIEFYDKNEENQKDQAFHQPINDLKIVNQITKIIDSNNCEVTSVYGDEIFISEEKHEVVKFPFCQIEILNKPNISNPISTLDKPICQTKEKYFNIILLGESGSGKSSLINLLANSIENNNYENIKFYVDLEGLYQKELRNNINLHDQGIFLNCSGSSSCTHDVTITRVYDSVSKLTYQFFDTPGIDPNIKGEIDSSIVDVYKKLFEFLDNVDAILFVQKSDCKTCLDSVFCTIKSLSTYIDKFKCKIHIVYTFYAGSLLFNIESLPFCKKLISKKQFKIDNMIFYTIFNKDKPSLNKIIKFYEKSKLKADKIMKLIKSY